MTDRPDIDRAVALEVMGWTSKWFDRKYVPGTDHWHQDQVSSLDHCSGTPVEYFGPEDRSTEEVTRWHPTQNMNQAMLVVEKLEKEGYSICITSEGQVLGHFVVRFSRGQLVICRSGGLILPMLICEAALKLRKGIL